MNILFCAGPPEVMALGAGRRFFFGLLIEKIYSGLCCAIAYLSGAAPVKEAPGCVFFFGLFFGKTKRKVCVVLLHVYQARRM